MTALNKLLFATIALLVSITVADVEFGSTLSAPRAGFSAIEAGSKVYFIGGFEYGDQRATSTIEVYDLVAQNMSSPLQLNTSRAFITPVVIEPNIYMIGGIDYSNPPFVYDSAQRLFVNYTTGPTVAKPRSLTMHNSYLSVIGSNGVDVFDLQLGAWKDTAPLRTVLSELAKYTLFSTEGAVIVLGGVNVVTGVISQSAWVYNIASGDLQEYPNLLPASLTSLNSDSDIAITALGSDGVITIDGAGLVLLHHLERRQWQTFEFPGLGRVLSSSNMTFLFNSSIVAAFDWNTNDAVYENITDLRHTFMANGVAVYLKLGNSNTLFRVYNPDTREWNTTNTLPTTFYYVAPSVTLKSGWHIFVTPASAVYGYHPVLNALHQLTDADTGFYLKDIKALIPAEETDQVFVFENGTITKTQFTAAGVTNHIKKQNCAANFVPVVRFGLDFLDKDGRLMNLNSSTLVTSPNVNLVKKLATYIDEHFVLMEGEESNDIGAVNYERVDVYNYVTNEWADSIDLPMELTGTVVVNWFYSAAALDNKLVMWMYNVMAVYDPITSNWTTYTNYTARLNNGTNADIYTPVPTAQGLAFIRTNDRSLDVFSAEALPSWNSTSLAPTVEQRTQYNLLQCLVYNDSQLYITALTPAIFNTLYIYDIATDTWQYTQLPNAVKSVPTIALAGNYLLSMNEGVFSYIDLRTGVESSQTLNFTLSPAIVLETSANVTFIAGGINGYGAYSNRLMIIPHEGIAVNAPTSNMAPSAQGSQPSASPDERLSDGELAAAIVVPVVVLVAAALLVFFLVRRNKRRRRQGSSNTMIGLAGKYGQWFIPFESIKFGDQLGQGASGQVFKGTWNSTTVALKVSMTQANSTVISELELMMQLRPHPNVIQLFGFSVHPETDSIILVIEYCNGGSLDDALFEVNQEIPLQQKLLWLLGMAKGLEHLHANNIVHRDIAARNVLLHQNEPKITDFGMSRLMDSDKQRGTTKSELGPIRWMAPESLKSKEYSNKSDIWSFGVLMFEVIAQSQPHNDADPIEIGRLIRDNGLTPTIPSSCPSELAQLMKECWRMSPDKRISIDKIVLQLEAMQNV